MQQKTVRRSVVRHKILILGAIFLSGTEPIADISPFSHSINNINRSKNLSLGWKGIVQKRDISKENHNKKELTGGSLQNNRKYPIERIECKYISYSVLPAEINENECKIPRDRRLPNTDEMAILEILTSEDILKLSDTYLLIDQVASKLDLRDTGLRSAATRLQLNSDEIRSATGDEKIEILRQLANFVGLQIYYDAFLGKYSMYLIDYVQDFNQAQRYFDTDKIPDIDCFFNIIYMLKLFEQAASQTASALILEPLLFSKFLTLKKEVQYLIIAKMAREIFYKETEDAEFLGEGFLVSMEMGGLDTEVSEVLEEFHPNIESLVVLEKLISIPNIRVRLDLQKIRSIWEQKYKKTQESESICDPQISDREDLSLHMK